MTCNDIQQCLIDENLPRPDGLTEHLSTCAQCGPFAKSLSVARQLRGTVPVQGLRVPVAKAKRRVQLTAAFALLGVGLLTEARLGHDWLTQHLGHHDSVVTVSPENRVIPVVQADDAEAAAWRSLAMLSRDTDEDTRRNPRLDPATQGFGALSQWVSPTATHPIRSLQLQNTDIAYTSED